jgi:hypothetical protein
VQLLGLAGERQTLYGAAENDLQALSNLSDARHKAEDTTR